MQVTVADVSFTYPSGVVALRHINLAIPAGTAVAIIGENGAGKTTLAKHLNGLLKPGQGRVLVGEWDTREHTVAQLAGRVGYVFQNPDDQLFESTVWAEVAFGPRNLGRPDEAVRAQVTEALSQVQLEHEAQTHPYDLHASQRKVVALAAVLAMKTPIVVFDEPTTGQDAQGVARAAAMPTFFDPGPGNPAVDNTWHAEMAHLATVLLATEEEAGRLTGLADPLASARALLANGSELVVIKRSAAGCLLLTGKEVEISPGFPVEARDATGAGDSLNAAVIYGHLRGLSLPELGTLANATGAAKVQKLGTGHNLPTVGEVRSILQRFGKDLAGWP